MREKQKKRILFIIREFYPFKRPSGVISLLRELILSFEQNDFAISVMSVRKKDEKKQYTFKGIPILKFNQFNLIEFFLTVKKVSPDKVIYISSMTSSNQILLWWGIIRVCTPSKQIFFYQVTNPFSLQSNIFIKFLLKSFKKVFAASKHIKQLFLKNLGLSTPLILPGMDINSIKYAPKSSKKINSIGFFGHLVYIKGFDYFIDLANSHPDLQFYLVAGNARKPTSFETQTTEVLRKMKNIKFYGFIKNPLEIMNRCDLIVLPYRSGSTVLGVAQSAIEAMAMGIPVIGSHNSALDSLIVSGKNGYLCSSTLEISKKINLLKNDSVLYNRISHEARLTIEKQFTISTTVNNLITYLYE